MPLEWFSSNFAPHYTPALWLRYAKHTERCQGPDAARAVLQRATRVFVKRHADVHLALARFEERQGDADAAREVFAHVAGGRRGGVSPLSRLSNRASHFTRTHTRARASFAGA